jgi:hypothetical protein
MLLMPRGRRDYGSEIDTMMDAIEIIESRFESHLRKSSESHELSQFRLAYIGLLFLFKDEIAPADFYVLQERQRQLRGEKFCDRGFEELKKSSRSEMSRDVGSDPGRMRESMLHRLMFCALLDTEESHVSYLTEPMFEFASEMGVKPEQLERVLESEFVGFKS